MYWAAGVSFLVSVNAIVATAMYKSLDRRSGGLGTWTAMPGKLIKEIYRMQALRE